jgi:DNA cross-link repair 1C protein
VIEGDGAAILYTGDIRSEPWFVNSLSRNPTVVEYTHGVKTLDRIYLDTSFTKNVPFQTKAEGIAELLRKVARYPDDTIFHFQAWTYGYEEVWIALSKALKSQVSIESVEDGLTNRYTKIHVDNYKLKVYGSLRAHNIPHHSYPVCPEAPALVGFQCANKAHAGCLTSSTASHVRLHSCEKGNMCDAAKGPNVVRIIPIVANLCDGTSLAEVGVGGGADDLVRETELAQGDWSTFLKRYML